MEYKPIKGKVNVGSWYYPSLVGLIYCWESAHGYEAKDNLKGFIERLRHFNVDPLQIENVGTDNPFLTSKLNDRQHETLLKGLSRPIIRVLKMKLPNTPEDYETDIAHPYIIQFGSSPYKRCTLNDVPDILTELECSRSDLILHEETEDSYAPLSPLNEFHILSNTIFQES